MQWHDITYLKQAETEAKASQQHIQQLVDNSPNPIFSTDREGCIQQWNPACITIFQYGPEMIGQSYQELLDPEIERRLEKRSRRYLKAGSPLQASKLNTVVGRHRTIYGFTPVPIIRHRRQARVMCICKYRYHRSETRPGSTVPATGGVDYPSQSSHSLRRGHKRRHTDRKSYAISLERPSTRIILASCW